jgi:hypothetical protein
MFSLLWLSQAAGKWLTENNSSVLTIGESGYPVGNQLSGPVDQYDV